MQGVRRSASFFFKLFRGLCLATSVQALSTTLDSRQSVISGPIMKNITPATSTIDMLYKAVGSLLGSSRLLDRSSST